MRVADYGQTAWFSSRGPNADGRQAPDVMADGFVIGAGLGNTSNSISISTGTSFSTPTVSGIAAVLAGAEFSGGSGGNGNGRGRGGGGGGPSVTPSPIQIRNAIVASGNGSIIQDGSTVFDQGQGWVDAAAAHDLLAGGAVSESLPVPSNPGSVESLLPSELNVEPTVVNNKPVAVIAGQRTDLIYKVWPNDDQLTVTVSNVSVPTIGGGKKGKGKNQRACVQNPVFGEDEIRLAIHTAKTSAFPPIGFYYDLNPSTSLHGFISETDPFTANAPGVFPGACGNGECTFVLADPEPGLARISLSGATENACNMTAEVSIAVNTAATPAVFAIGTIDDGETYSGSFTISQGVSMMIVTLEWIGDWGQYPTNDLDLVLRHGPAQPSGNGVTLNSPETIHVKKPASGTWNFEVIGFEVFATESWKLTVLEDGVAVQ